MSAISHLASRQRNAILERMQEAAPKPASKTAGAKGGFKAAFASFLDVINPLQHIPVVGAIYRTVTGDAISDGAKLAGGALYGGGIGAGLALADIGLKKASGKDAGETVMAMFESPATKTVGGENLLADASGETTTAVKPKIEKLPVAAVVPPESDKLAKYRAYPVIMPSPTPIVPLAKSSNKVVLPPEKPGMDSVAVTANPPVDVAQDLPADLPPDLPQRMMQALDAYQKLQTGRNTANLQGTGTQGAGGNF